MSFLQNSLLVAFVMTGSLLACSATLAKPLPPNEGCRRVSKIEYNAAKREYLLKSRARMYIRTGSLWRRHYWHCPVWSVRAQHEGFADCRPIRDGGVSKLSPNHPQTLSGHFASFKIAS